MGSRARAVFLAAGLLGAASAATALDAPGVRWVILPSSSPTGIPASVAAEAGAGPIGTTVSNGSKPGLLHSGTALVDFGATALQSEITHALGPASTNGFCFPGPCGSSRGQWIDLVTITASGVPDGTIGSFTAQLVVDGAFDAVVPLGWNFQGASVFGDYTAEVWVEGERRDQIAVSCFAVPSLPCLLPPVFNRIHYPEDYPTSPQQRIPLSGPFGSFDVGPYDFVFGAPFSLEVDGFAETSLSRGINASGTPTVTTDLALTWDGLVRVNGAAGLGGDDLPPGSVQVATASGVDWVAAPVPEPTTGAGATLVGTLALLYRLRAKPRRTPFSC